MRVVYNNAADRATIVASATAGNLAASNLQTDTKSEIWRSTGTTASLTVTWGLSESVSMVAFPICSLSPTATIKVRCRATPGGADILDTGPVQACPGADYKLYAGSSATPGANLYAYGGGSYAVVWFSAQTVRELVIDIVDTNNTLGYVEASRLVTGTYWEPVYDATYGVQLGIEDLSKSERSDAGDLKTDRGAMFKTIRCDLGNVMPAADRQALWGILRANGLYKPVYVSMVPTSTDAYEQQAYQIYGKLSKQSTIGYQYLNQFDSSIELEEI